MIAVDTNVVVRLLVGDDAAQLRRARALFTAEQIFVAKTVMLEAEWVLRALYALPAVRIADALEGLLSLPNVQCEDLSALSEALSGMRAGLDFADALHIASSRGRAARFMTFDRKFARRAKALGVEAL